MVRQRKNLGIGLLLIGAFFLFEPTMAGVLDLLPDAIGCLLMMIGLRALADLDDYMESAITMFKRMLIVGTCRFFSAFWLFGFCTPKERPVTTLLIAFVAGVFELIFLTSAFKAMFDGFLYLGSRHDGTAMFGDQQKNRKPSDRRQEHTERRAGPCLCPHPQSGSICRYGGYSHSESDP